MAKQKKPELSKITHKVFASAAIDLRILKPNVEIYEEIREMVQTYINDIGAEKVVAINECIEAMRLTIVVWHLADEAESK
jgi:hypothetical protein